MSIDRAAARQAVRASGERWLRTRADALHLQRGRRLARVLDLDVMTGRAGDARVRSRTLVLARDPRHPDVPAAACPPVPGERIRVGGQREARQDGVGLSLIHI